MTQTAEDLIHKNLDEIKEGQDLLMATYRKLYEDNIRHEVLIEGRWEPITDEELLEMLA